MYDAEKAAQVAALFLTKAPDHVLDRVKLMKLMYLADRESFSLYGATITDDRFYSLDHGPVPSASYDLSKGAGDIEQWSRWVTSGSRPYEHQLTPGANIEDADALSRADVSVIEAVWDRVGDLSTWDLKDWCHKNLPEYQEPPPGSSIAINSEDLCNALGIDEEECRSLSEFRRDQDSLDRLFATLR